MNILITGANGQLGNEMRIIASQQIQLDPARDNYIFTDVIQAEGVETTHLDITDLQAIRQVVTRYNIQAIINCAAYTNVDAAETNQSLAELLNCTAPHNLAIAMNEVGGLLVHISTDYVFGAEPYNTPCQENQTGTPTGVYGLTKLHGEQNIISVAKSSQLSYVIIRTAWLYSEFSKNFCKTMLNLTATKSQLKVVIDQVGTPTYAWDLAKAIEAVINDYKKVQRLQLKAQRYANSGIYNFSNEGVCSWYDFAKMIQKTALQLKVPDSEHMSQCDIQPCRSYEFTSPVTRPSYSVLDKTKFKQTFGITVPYWIDSLKVCISNIIAQKWK